MGGRGTAREEEKRAGGRRQGRAPCGALGRTRGDEQVLILEDPALEDNLEAGRRRLVCESLADERLQSCHRGGVQVWHREVQLAAIREAHAQGAGHGGRAFFGCRGGESAVVVRLSLRTPPSRVLAMKS
jgi:hypothetical protein